MVYETRSVLGERGQITIPKTIRELKGFKPRAKLIVKIENGKVVVEKEMSKKEKEKLMKEYYVKYAKENEKLAEEMIVADTEALEELDEY
ncbi:MAG: AbrB/MazE/SpoVT family DNA-binding domain-containing protein [archaeon]